MAVGSPLHHHRSIPRARRTLVRRLYVAFILVVDLIFIFIELCPSCTWVHRA